MPLTVLAFVAHPTDAIDMIGGTLAAHHERGDRVVTVVVNSSHHTIGLRAADEIAAGQRSADAETVEAAGRAYEQQTREGFAVMDCGELRFLYAYGEVMLVNPWTVADIATMIQEVRPHLMITHHPLEGGLCYQHSAVGRMVVEATFVAYGARENGLPPHRVAQTFFFTPPGEVTSLDNQSADRYPQIMIDVERYTARKIAALSHLKGTYYNERLAAKVVQATSSTHAALLMGVNYAETFVAYLPDVRHHLPVSDHLLEIASESWEQKLQRVQCADTTP